MSVEMQVSGLLFYLIIITNLASNVFGYQTFFDGNIKSVFQKIIASERNFTMGFVLIVIEHFCIIALAISLFFAFNMYSMLLAILWMVSRITEGLIQIYQKRSYWRLLALSRRYTKDNKQVSLDQGIDILKEKDRYFLVAQLFFTVGTLAYSITFIISGIVPVVIGWSGIVISVAYGMGNLHFLGKTKSQGIWEIGGLFVLIFELVLGAWLLFFT